MRHKILKQMVHITAVIMMAFLVAGCAEFLDSIDSSGPYSYSEADKLNEEGLALVEEGAYDDALQSFNAALNSGLDEDVYYNNLCYLYNEMGDYETALEYIQYAIDIEPGDSTQLLNQGHSYMGLGYYEQAIDSYTASIDANHNENYAYSSLGYLYYEIGDYERAKGYYEEYLDREPDDLEMKLELINCHYMLGDLLKANSYADTVIEDHPDEYDAYDYKGLLLEYLDSEKNVVAYYDDVKEQFPEVQDSWINLAVYYFDIGSYNKAIELYQEAIEQFPEYGEAHGLLSQAYLYSGEFELALEYGQIAIALDPVSDTYNNYGNLLMEDTRYLESVPYYEEAEALNPYYDDTYITNMMYAYYADHRYLKCIEAGLAALEVYPESYDVNWILGYAYMDRNDYENADKYISAAVEIDPLSDVLLYRLALTQYYMGNYDQAKAYIDQSLEVNPENYESRYLDDELALYDKGHGNVIQRYIQDYYLYADNSLINGDMKDVSSTMSEEEAAELFYSYIEPDDPYSFYVGEEWYDYLIEEEEGSISFDRLNDGSHLIDVYFFGDDTDHHFIEYIDEIESPESSNLIINLVDNGGGSTQSAYEMLDTLLPYYTAFTEIDRTGYSYPYMTSESMVTFNHIYILINENSASASELLALALSTYLDNVTIIGEQSHGKGVGQIVYNDPIRREAMFLVNHYINVREQNISEVGVVPDVVVENMTFEKGLVTAQNIIAGQ